MIGDGQRVAVALVAKHEFAFVIGAPQIIRANALGKSGARCPRSRSRRVGHQAMTIQDGVDRAAGRYFDCVRQSPQQALADLACAPIWLLALGCDDCRFDLLGQLIGVPDRPSSPVTQPLQATLFIPLEDLIARLP